MPGSRGRARNGSRRSERAPADRRRTQRPTHHPAIGSRKPKPRFLGAWLRRGTQESNLALRFWRPRRWGILACKYRASRFLGIVLGVESRRGQQAPTLRAPAVASVMHVHPVVASANVLVGELFRRRSKQITVLTFLALGAKRAATRLAETNVGRTIDAEAHVQHEGNQQSAASARGRAKGCAAACA